MNVAVTSGDTEAFASAFGDFAQNIEDAVMQEARGMIQASDNTVLSGRGVRALTSEENDFYQSVIEAMRSSNPQQALTDTSKTFPTTVIDAVFEDLANDHPLLDLIDFQNTSGLIEYLVNTGSAPLATWKALTATIADEVVRGFNKIDLSHKKLSAFLPVGKAMLDLGPAWLDRFARAILGEALANGLEKGIIKGDGLLEPVGMIKNLAAAVDPTTGYADKVKVPVADFGPEAYGGLISRLIVGSNGVIRNVAEAVLIVNPVDYLNKIMPATTQLINGTYVNNIFPFPTKVVTSSQVTIGSAILGIGKKYFMGLGTQKGGKVEYSDEYRFLEDERVYIVKLYGTGRPVDNGAFLHLDISKLKPAFPVVRTTNYTDNTLKSLVIAGVTLAPVFDKDVTYYAVATATATNKVTVAAEDVNAVVTMTLNGVAATSGQAQTWVEGQNIVYITVTNAGNVMNYVLVVTYTAA